MSWGSGKSGGIGLAPRRPARAWAFRGARSWCAALLLLGLVALAWADAATAAPLRRLGQNPRGLAMGNTGVSYSDDEMALYYNPAGLGAIDRWWFELLPIVVEASGEAVDLVSTGDFGTFDDPVALIRENIGKEIQLRAFTYPTAMFHFGPGVTVGLGYFYELEVGLKIRNQATPEIQAFYRQDEGQVAGFSFPAAEGKFIIGLSARKLTRQSAEETLSSADLALASARGSLDLEADLDLKEGSGLGYDLGLIWRLESFARLRGQFGIVIQNAGGTDLGDVPEIPQEISLGWSFRPKLTPITNVLIAVELRDVTKDLTNDDSNNKRAHVGLELGVFPLDNATNVFSFRVGYTAGKTSAGFEWTIGHAFSLQYVVYYQEFGDVASEDPRKRQLIQINLFGF